MLATKQYLLFIQLSHSLVILLFLQLFGGPSGANNVDFNLKGSDWRWGSSYKLDSLVAAGSMDSAEGVQVDELSLATGGMSRRGCMPATVPRMIGQGDRVYK